MDLDSNFNFIKNWYNDENLIFIIYVFISNYCIKIFMCYIFGLNRKKKYGNIVFLILY